MTKPCLLSAERLKEIEEHAKNIAHAMPNTSQDINELLDHIGALNEMIAASSAPIGDGEIEEAITSLDEIKGPYATAIANLLRRLRAKLGEVEKERDVARKISARRHSRGVRITAALTALQEKCALAEEARKGFKIALSAQQELASLSQAALAKAEKERDEALAKICSLSTWNCEHDGCAVGNDDLERDANHWGDQYHKYKQRALVAEAALEALRKQTERT